MCPKYICPKYTDIFALWALLIKYQMSSVLCQADLNNNIVGSTVDEKAKFRNRYSRIPHAAKDTKRERDTGSQTLRSTSSISTV